MNFLSRVSLTMMLFALLLFLIPMAELQFPNDGKTIQGLVWMFLFGGVLFIVSSDDK